LAFDVANLLLNPLQKERQLRGHPDIPFWRTLPPLPRQIYIVENKNGSSEFIAADCNQLRCAQLPDGDLTDAAR
jgi:hypothetical protein